MTLFLDSIVGGALIGAASAGLLLVNGQHELKNRKPD